MAISRNRTGAIVRQFPQNGLRMLLQNPGNVRDLLALVDLESRELIDFDQMAPVPTTFVQRDYRHVEADLVLRAPLRRSGKERQVTIYILIEHQSEPDPLMAFRVLEYVVQIYKAQTRHSARRKGTLSRPALQPVIPMVIYTGLRPWKSLGRMPDLVERGREFERLIPALDPVFVNLPATPAGKLESEGGSFGWVLRLVQERHSRLREFQSLLQRVVASLEQLPSEERMRWLDLLSYIHALVYHERVPSEHRGLQEEALQARRQILLDLLRERFGAPTASIAQVIERTNDITQLDSWLRAFATAESLEEIGIQ